jgi:hypothetical protein
VTMSVVSAERTHAGMSDPFIDVIDWSCKMRQARTREVSKGDQP